MYEQFICPFPLWFVKELKFFIARKKITYLIRNYNQVQGHSIVSRLWYQNQYQILLKLCFFRGYFSNLKLAEMRETYQCYLEKSEWDFKNLPLPRDLSLKWLPGLYIERHNYDLWWNCLVVSLLNEYKIWFWIFE